ncbi:hypothetical protein K7432_004806 [Basidiobolus ranarum]|uniref:C2H2-type domain-containing protein n=1 Tax=Basidiobolus ranarum TaxID=34480 RepID=A0ABR2W429_9FUNG
MLPSNTLPNELISSFTSYTMSTSQETTAGHAPYFKPTQNPHFDICESNRGDSYQNPYIKEERVYTSSPTSQSNMSQWRNHQPTNRLSEFNYDFSTRKHSSPTESECSSTFSSPGVSCGRKSVTTLSECSGSISKVSDIHKLLNYEENSTSVTALPLNTEFRANKLPNMYSATSPTHTSFHPESQSPYAIKAQYHPYLGNSRGLYHPRAVSFNTNPTLQGHCLENSNPHDRYYSYLHGNPYTNPIDAKNHLCQYPGCYMRFKRLEHLKRHFRVHTLERPYACTHNGCEKTFSRRDNLGQHLKTHERRVQRQEQLQKSDS